jgi:chemotaxis protein histidine kinase CheA
VSASDEVDLQSLFAAEIDERSARLAEGATRLHDTPLDAESLATMVREGHTIKGTARMMGFIAISDAGKLLEDGWRYLRDGELEASSTIADALALLTGEVRAAVDADPATGTPGLAAGMRVLRVALHDQGADAPEPTHDPVPTASDFDGLLGTIGTLGFGDNVRVDAANLYRLINELCSLRVDVEVLAEKAGSAVADGSKVAELAALVEQIDASVVELQERAVELAAMPLSEITATFVQLVRYIARRSDKDVRLEMTGTDTVADRQVVERLSDPLRHLLVNAVEHGIETVAEREARGKPRTGSLRLAAEVTGQRLTITIEDDGRGVDWAAVQRVGIRRGLIDESQADDRDALRSLLFTAGVSTVPDGELVWDGSGLALVSSVVESLQGTLTFDTEPGKGTRVVIAVPRSRALQDAVIVTAAGQDWGIPELSILESLRFADLEIHETESRREVSWHDRWIPVVGFADAVGLRPTGEPDRLLVVSTTSGPVGLAVEFEKGRRQVAARELGPVLAGIPHLTGAALLGAGDVIVLVDPTRLADRARAAETPTGPRPKVLVVDDSRGARQVVGGALGSAGFEVELAGSPTEALSVLAEQSFDALVVDYQMPTMDGATLAARIRELGIDSPIIMLSGVATAADASRAIEAGANAYLDKDDVRKGALAEAIRGLVKTSD